MRGRHFPITHLEYRAIEVESIEHRVSNKWFAISIQACKQHHDIGGAGVDLRDTMDISDRYSAMYDAE